MGDSDWTLVSSNINGNSGSMIIENLTPGTWYNVLMTAHNDAGSTDAEYVFATLTLSGETVSPLSPGATNSHHRFYKQLSIVVPLVCAAVIVLVVTVVVCAIFSRRHSPMRYRPRQDGDGLYYTRTGDNGVIRPTANQKLDTLGMTPMNCKKNQPTYEAPKESLYFPAPYATSRLSGYAPEDAGSECDSLPSSTRNSGDHNMTGHTYDVPFPVMRWIASPYLLNDGNFLCPQSETEEQYTRIKRVPVPSVPVKNIYQTPQLPESDGRWTRRLSYQTQSIDGSSVEPGFSYKVGSPAARRWSGGYRVPFRKDQPFKLKSYQYSDDASDLEDEDDRPGEISEAECDRSHLTVMIPPENKNFYILTGTVQ